MADRRMLSLKIINSAKFLKMPIDAQNLYFHLAIRADDDGIVEAFSAMRLIGSAEDNLKILDAKGFVRVLNEDLVTYITDWLEHNKLRADRKVDSIYQNLLVEILPDVELLDPKDRADRPKQLGTSHGQPDVSVREVKISKVNTVKDKEESPEYDRLATLLMELHQVGDPAFTKSDAILTSWARSFRLLHTHDNRPLDEIEKVLRWAKKPDGFWFANIISGSKFRTKYDTLRPHVIKAPTADVVTDYKKGW